MIEESSSPWMSPAVFAKNKTGELYLCVYYREPNKKRTHDVYLLPLPNEVRDCLASLDLQCGYWQIPRNPMDSEKTAFSHGPSMEPFQMAFEEHFLLTYMMRKQIKH